MNKQTNELLILLLGVPGQTFTYETLAGRFHVSTRTIRNYVQGIQDFLSLQKKEGMLQVSRQGIRIDGTAQDIDALRKAMKDPDFNLYCLSPDERCVLILLTLLMSDDYCTVSQLSDKFQVSRGTVLKDMEQVRELLKHQGISLFPMLNKGYLLEISESERRRLILRNIQSSSNLTLSLNCQAGICFRYLENEYELNEYLEEITRTLLEMEELYHLTVADAGFDEIKLTLAIMLRRMTGGHYIVEQYYEVPLMRDFVVFEIAERILERLCGSFGCTYMEQDLRFLADVLYTCRFYRSQTVEDAKDLQLCIAVTSFLMQTGKELGLPLHRNQQIIEQLQNHVRSIEKARWEGEYFQSEFRDAVKTEYPQYYNTVRTNIHILERGISFRFTEDELTYVLFYIIAAAEQYFQQSQKPSVIVVCHSGIGTANFLAGQLRSNFNLRIVAVTSRHKLETVLEEQEYDLIVSTIALDMDEAFWLRVSPLLGLADILTLQKRLIEIRNRKRQERIQKRMELGGGEEGSVISGALQNFALKRKNILLDVECRDWKEAVETAAGLLLAEHSVEPVYIQKIIESVLRYGPYFVYCPRVALAHAGPHDGVRSFGLSLIRLKTPVAFGHQANDPVSYVLCFAGRQDDVRMHDMLSVMNLLSIPEELKELDAITDPDLFLETIKNKRMEEAYEEQ